jgi:hypothetical protein
MTGECCTRCQQFDNCTAFTWLNGSPPYNNYCSLKLANVGHTTTRSVGATSGWRYGIPPPPPPMGGVFLKAAWAGEVSNLDHYELTIQMFVCSNVGISEFTRSRIVPNLPSLQCSSY